MGNKPVTIGVRLDRTACEAGGTLSGRVYLSVQTNIASMRSRKPTRASGIHLVLSGDEMTKVIRYRHEGEGDQRERRRYVHNDTNTLIQMDVPLATFPDGVVRGGQYEYPFEWPIPDTLPSSMHMEKGESSCEISYQVTAYLAGSGQGFLSQDYSSSTGLIIFGQSSDQSQNSIEMDPEIFPLKSCCFSRGSLKFGWDADRTVGAPGAVVNVGVVGKNDSVLDVQLRARIMETVEWRSSGGHQERREQVLSDALLNTDNFLNWNRLPELPSRAQRRRENPYESLSDLQRVSAQLRIPLDANDTYYGSLINVRHILVVRAVMPDGCCVNYPESSVAVKIQRRLPVLSNVTVASADLVTPAMVPEEPLVAMAQVLPPDWSPEEADVVVIPANSVVGRSASAMDLPVATATATIGTSANVGTATTFASAPIEDDPYHPPNVAPSAPPKEDVLHDFPVNIASLQASLASSRNPADTMTQFIRHGNAGWLKNLSPHEFVETLKTCHAAQVGVAKQLAAAMVPNFYCRHVLACIWGLPPKLRFEVLKEVAPLASDLNTQRAIVERELDPTELKHFRNALK